MRIGILIFLVGVLTTAWGQDGNSAQSEAEIPFSMAPQVFVTVVKPEIGSDLVTVTAREEDYNPALLKFQCQQVGKFAGTESRGIEIKGANIGSQGASGLVRATFACDGLINRENKTLNIDAIVKAFLGSPKPMISSFLIQFEGEEAGPQTIRRIVNQQYMLEGKNLANPTGLEYRVEVLTQDTRAFTIPSSLSEVPKVKETQQTNKLHPLVIPSLVVGLIAASALVYFAVLRPRPKPRGK
ncbi:MAG: hypothetical protein KF824_02910 [Fimbriimonadaceae bacterium]|nr:MAG: hypothetical protein KF824_02910 [Fimbriimonadaceae bacterium]